MDYYSSWPFFLCMALLLALSATPFFNSIAAPTTARTDNRPILMVSAVSSHLVSFSVTRAYHEYMQRRGSMLSHRFYNLAAKAASLFSS